MNIELLTILLIASVLLLSLVGVLLWRTGGDAAQVERIKAWALAAVGAAYNVAIDELKITGELPSGEKRRELAVAYYQTIPEDERTFTAEEFANAVELVFELVDWGGTQLHEYLD
ncbi:hypothetical protein KC887_09355 [Candidatus Kaiserbacteria bacterium]|nr:hypothetical protein [Candidatus Kaiserbacteria bacterium]